MVKFVDYAFNKLGKQHQKALSQHQDQIRDYFWMNKIDGEAFHNTKKQQFIINISKHIACQQNKQKMNALASLWAFINFAHTVPKKKGESRSAFSTPATSPKPPTHTPSMTYNISYDITRRKLPSKHKLTATLMRNNYGKSKSFNPQAIHRRWNHPYSFHNKLQIRSLDIKFKWKQHTTMFSCDHNHFLYIVSKVIDEMNDKIISDENSTKLLLNKNEILWYLNKINVDGLVFRNAKTQFIDNVQCIVFDSGNINNINDDMSLQRLKQKYTYNLYDNISKYTLNSISEDTICIIHCDANNTVSNPLLQQNISSIIWKLNQYQHTSYLQDEEKIIMETLEECNDKISSVLCNKWSADIKTKTCCWNYNIRKIEECSLSGLLYILELSLFNYNKQQSNHEMSLKIMEYFEQNRINGLKFKSYSQQNFVSALHKFISIYIHNDNRNLHLQLSSLYNHISNVNVFQITKLYIKNDVKWNDSKQILKQCNIKDILYILIHTLSDRSFFKLNEFEDRIIQYFVENRINGPTFIEFGQQKFADNICKFIKYNNPSHLVKLYYKIKKCPLQDMINISDKNEKHNISKFVPWNKRTNFKNIKRVGYIWDDGVIEIADIVSPFTEENKNKIELHTKMIGYDESNVYLKEPFWLTLPSNKLCEPTKENIQQSHLKIFNKWLMILRIKNKLKTPFESNIFEQIAKKTQTHPQLIFTLRYCNYATKLEDKTYENVLQSCLAFALSRKCRQKRCQSSNKPKMRCYCNANEFQKYTYYMIMTIMAHNNQEKDDKMHQETILGMLQNESDNTYALATKLCSYLPQQLQQNNNKYFIKFTHHVHYWLLHDFYNIICSHCGDVNKSIMINRVFIYSNSLRNCRTCGVIIRKRHDDDDIINVNLPMQNENKSYKTYASIKWFCNARSDVLNNENINIEKLTKSLSQCKFDKRISYHSEFELLSLLYSLLIERFKSLTYYLSRFLDDINEWKALRLSITANYYFYACGESVISVDRLMKDAAVNKYHTTIFKDCWLRSLFQSMKDNNELIHLLDEETESKHNDVLCTDLHTLSVFRKLTPSISRFITSLIKQIKTIQPSININIDLLALIERFLQYKIDENVFPIIDEMEFISLLSNKWDYLRDPMAKYRYLRPVSYWKNDKTRNVQYVESTSQSLKDEILRHIDSMNSEQFDLLVSRADTIWQNLKHITSINTGTRISQKHILSVLLFVEFSELRNKISTLFTQTDKNEIKIHTNFGRLLRLLKETVLVYGDLLKTRKTFYYTINNKMLFDKFMADFNLPIIASSKPPSKDKINKSIIVELQTASTSAAIAYFNASVITGGKELYIFFGGTFQIKNIHFIDDDTNRLINEPSCIEAISLFEHIMNGTVFVHPLNQLQRILEQYIKHKLHLVTLVHVQDKENIIPSSYYFDLFNHCFDYYLPSRKRWIDEKQVKQYITNSFLKKKFSNVDLLIQFNNSKCSDRKMLQVGSKCKIFSNSQKKWFIATIVTVYNQYQEEWLELNYDDDKFKPVQRDDAMLQPIRIDEWCNIMWKYCVNKYKSDTCTSYSMDRFTITVRSILNQCNINCDAKLLLRIKTVLAFYRTSQNTIPNFETLIKEANISVSDALIYDNFRIKYMTQRSMIQQSTQLKLTNELFNSKCDDYDYDIKQADTKMYTKSKQTDTKNHQLYDIGIFMRYDVTNPRFESLSEEIMFNDVVNISNEKFNKYLDKAKEMHLENSLTMVASSNDYHYGIEKFCPISISHIISIIIHTEEPTYSRAFTRSCLSISNTDSELIIQNHVNNFYWLGKYIYECVEYFGETIHEESSNKHLQGLNSTFKFELFAPPINFPRSTTNSMHMALYYAGTNGFVMELIPKYSGVLNSTKFIDLHSMSQDYDDDKRLVFGKACAIQIKNIILSNHQSLRQFILPLVYLEKLMLQTVFDSPFFNAKHLYDTNIMTGRSEIQSVLYGLIKCCVSIIKFHKLNAINDASIIDKDAEIQIINKYFPHSDMRKHDLLYVVNLLKHWCFQRTFITFESFAAELPFMTQQLRNFFVSKNQQKQVQINIKNLQMIMPNLIHYRNFNKQVIRIEKLPTQEMTTNVPQRKGLIDLINNNLYDYYKSQHDNTYYQEQNQNKVGKFKAWCIRNKYDDVRVEKELQKPTKHCLLIVFDKYNFPYPQDLNIQRLEFIKRLLINATKPNLIQILYGNNNEFTLSQRKSIISPNIVEIQAGDTNVVTLLPNCQRHEIPDIICEVLESLGYFREKFGLLDSATSNTNFPYPSLVRTNSKKQKHKEGIIKWRNRNRHLLVQFFDPISKMHQATRDDFIKVSDEIGLFENQDMHYKLSDMLIERLFMDIEKIKPWNCKTCWFLNRKMMIGGLWCLYNQLNECGLCGKNKHKIKRSKKWIEGKTCDKKIIDSTEVQFELPTKLKKEWESVKRLKCSIEEKKNNCEQQYLELCNVDKMKEFVTDWIEDQNDKNINLRKRAILNYFEEKKIDGQTFLNIKRKTFLCGMTKKLGTSTKWTAKILRLHKTINNIGINCEAMKRIAIILNHYHTLTDKLYETNNRYPYLIRQFLAKLSNRTRSQILNDFDHVLDHNESIKYNQPYITKCDQKEECIHFKRTKRSDDIKQTLKQKQDLFNCNDWRDFTYISYLSKIHCSLLHYNEISNISIDSDKHKIHRYSKYIVYSTGVYIDHATLLPLHVNLKEELLNNNVYTMREINFKSALKQAQDIMSTKKWNNDKKLIAKQTNDTHGIKIGDPIQIEHVFVVHLYCSNSQLCRTFRESYRTSEFDDNNQHIRAYHVNNFYWMGRFCTSAIQLFGSKPDKKDIFFHGQRKKFLFTEFSTILEAPTSTTPDLNIARTKFSGSGGVVLKLAPKFKYELNNSKYLDVSSISNYEDENERLFAGMSVLAIIDIRYIFNGKCYDMGSNMKVLLYFERLITQTIHNKNYYNYGFVSTSLQKKYLYPLISHQMNRNNKNNMNYVNNDNDKEIHEYLYALFEHFCDNHDYINLTCIYDEIQTMDKTIQNVFFREGYGNNREINNDSIRLIFPKLKRYKNHLGYWITM